MLNAERLYLLLSGYYYQMDEMMGMVNNSGWVFGLLEFERKGQKCLELCEVYDFRDSRKGPLHGIGAASVDWKQFRTDKRLILHDLRKQAALGIEFYLDKKQKCIKMRRMVKKHKS